MTCPPCVTSNERVRFRRRDVQEHRRVHCGECGGWNLYCAINRFEIAQVAPYYPTHAHAHPLSHHPTPLTQHTVTRPLPQPRMRVFMRARTSAANHFAHPSIQPPAPSACAQFHRRTARAAQPQSHTLLAPPTHASRNHPTIIVGRSQLPPMFFNGLSRHFPRIFKRNRAVSGTDT